MEEKLSISNRTAVKIPGISFLPLKNEILGKGYSLSVAYLRPAKMRELNHAWRGKDKPTNILSFPLSKTSGEILLCPSVVKKEAAAKRKNFADWLGFLVIHGMLHLKGMRHGSKMEKAEDIYDKKYFHRSGHRNLGNESSGGRVPEGRKKS